MDTNVLVRLVTDDDPAQAAVARRVLAAALAEDEGCFVSDPVLCELEWVLESCYGGSRADVLMTMQRLVATDGFEFEDRGLIQRSIDAYEVGRGDFSDYLIGSKARARGSRVTYTFDRALRDQEGFVVLR